MNRLTFVELLRRKETNQNDETRAFWQLFMEVMKEKWGDRLYEEVSADTVKVFGEGVTQLLDEVRESPEYETRLKSIDKIRRKLTADEKKQIAKIKARIPEQIVLAHETYSVEYPAENMETGTMAILKYKPKLISIRAVGFDGRIYDYGKIIRNLAHEIGHALCSLSMMKFPDGEEEMYVKQFGEAVGWMMVDNGIEWPTKGGSDVRRTNNKVQK